MKHALILISFFVLQSCLSEEAAEPALAPTSIEDLSIEFININGFELLNYNSIYFWDDDTGFISGFDGVILKTVDGGYNWISQQSNTSLDLYNVYFINSQEGFIVGGNSGCNGTGCVPESGIILSTIDGGLTWNESFRPKKILKFLSIDFVDDNIGFAVGNNVVLKTMDKGVTWEEIEIEGLNGNMYNMTDIRFSNEMFGMISCFYDNMLVTTDGGNSWELVETMDNGGYTSVSVINETHSYVSSQSGIFVSNDIGQSWTLLNNSPKDIFDIHFIDEDIGFAFGSGHWSGGDFGHSHGSIYYTKDAGETWIGSSSVHETGLIKSISFPSNSIGYALSRNTLIKIHLENFFD